MTADWTLPVRSAVILAQLLPSCRCLRPWFAYYCQHHRIVVVLRLLKCQAILFPLVQLHVLRQMMTFAHSILRSVSDALTEFTWVDKTKFTYKL
ncbi:hypothetical protein TNCV_2641511 [Trichonephila clavipes]|nr:hypothetical protein TNCV_2641511 [Trichonephila clavipes]